MTEIKNQLNRKNTLLIGIMLSSLMFSCSGSQEDTKTPETELTEAEDEQTEKTIAKDVDAEEFKRLIGSGEGQILDVRTAKEFAAGNIQGAKNIDFYGENFESSLDSLDKHIPYYVHCQGGGRSSEAMEMMKNKGFTEVYNLLGGYGQWPYKD